MSSKLILSLLARILRRRPEPRVRVVRIDGSTIEIPVRALTRRAGAMPGSGARRPSA